MSDQHEVVDVDMATTPDNRLVGRLTSCLPLAAGVSRSTPRNRCATKWLGVIGRCATAICPPRTVPAWSTS